MPKDLGKKEIILYVPSSAATSANGFWSTKIGFFSKQSKNKSKIKLVKKSKI